MDTRELLRSVGVFSALDEHLLGTLAGLFRATSVPAGTILFAQQDQADRFFLVERGEVAITKKIGGHEKPLALLGPGSVFGEMAFFSDSPRTANAAARTDATLRVIARDDFMRFIAAEPQAGLKVLSGLLQVAMDRLEQTSRELATIYETGKIISSGRSMTAIARGVLDELLLAIPAAKDGAVFLYNTFNEEFDPVAAPEGAGTIAHGALGTAGGRLLPVADVRRSLALEFLPQEGRVLLASLENSGTVTGLLLLWGDDTAFDSSHALLVASVAGQLSAAVENIRHQQEERDRQRLSDRRQEY